MAGFTSLGLGLLIGGLAGGTAATVAAKRRSSRAQQTAADYESRMAQPRPQATTVAPPPTPPDATALSSDAFKQAQQAQIRIRKRMGGNTGISGGAMTPGGLKGQSPTPVIRPRQLVGGRSY